MNQTDPGWAGRTRAGYVAPLAGVLVVAIVFAGCKRQESADADSAGTGVSTADAESGVRAGGAGAEQSVFEQLPSLRRVQQALAGAPVNVYITRGDRLEEARSWIAEHKPELLERDAEVLAQSLVIWEDFIESEEISLARVIGMSETQLLGLWAMDANGDGRLSDAEASEGMQRMTDMGEVVEEYFSDRFDTDGDGELDESENVAREELVMANVQPVFDMMMERAGLIVWDSNADGSLSEEERTAGEAGFEFSDLNMDGQIDGMERMNAYLPLLEEFNEGLTLLESPDRTAIQEEMQRQATLLRAEMNRPPPLITDFDLDADGSYSEVEQAAFDQEMQTYTQQRVLLSEQMRVNGENMASRFMRMQFDVAVEKLDTDGDGLLMNEEWEAGYSVLRVERDRRMFEYLYDADRDGAISDPEVARFMDSYERKSVYADADLNGRIDESDLRHFMNQVTSR